MRPTQRGAPAPWLAPALEAVGAEAEPEAAAGAAGGEGGEAAAAAECGWQAGWPPLLRRGENARFRRL